jgi:hypothetical protein
MQRVESAARHAHRHPCLFIFLTALALRLCTALLLHLCNTFQGEPFDSSHLLASPLDGEDSTTPQSRSHSTLSTATLRWDAIHFVSIARDGYVWEQQLAFQPGWPLVLRIGSRVLRGTRAACHGVDVDWWSGVLGVGEIAQVGQVLASVSYAGAVVMLYKYVPVSLLHSRHKPLLAMGSRTMHSSNADTSDSPNASPTPLTPSPPQHSTSSPPHPPSCLPRTASPYLLCWSFQGTISARSASFGSRVSCWPWRLV